MTASSTTPIRPMRADWTAFGACTNGSTALPKGATRPGSGSVATTSTTEARGKELRPYDQGRSTADHRSHRETVRSAGTARPGLARDRQRERIRHMVRRTARRRVRGRLTIKGVEHLTLDMEIGRIEPERYFSYRWHPYAIDPKVDYSTEPTTLVEFRLDEIEGGKATAITIVESGFDKIPLARRAEAYRMNDKGWTGQAKKLVAYVA